MTVINGFAETNSFDKFNSSLLIEVKRPNGIFTCSGVAISKDTVITAAHCLAGKIERVKIFIGESYNPTAPYLEIKSFEIHPSYDSDNSNFEADIAKINLKASIPSHIKIFPVFQSKQISGKLYRFGFGARNKKNNRTVTTPVLRNVKEEIIELHDEYSKTGDSGGPIYLEKDGKTYILAIHSTFSHGPEGNYSFNPLLAPYLPWINKN